MSVCKRGTKRSLELNTLKSDRPHIDGPAAYLIAQQYSSATFVSLHFHYRKFKIWDNLKKTGNVRVGIAQHRDAFVQPLLRWKAISIIYSEYLFVVLETQHAPYCHLWPARLYDIFPHYLKNGTVSEINKVIKHQMCVFICGNKMPTRCHR